MPVEDLPVFETRRDPATVERKLNSLAWYHWMRFRAGGRELATPTPQQRTDRIWAALVELGLPEDMSGMRALDLGCCDGFYSFVMEQRGAEVTSLDYRDVSQGGFGVARDLIGSRIEPQVATVYELAPERIGRFDVVLFLGVLYHLRHPILALDKIRGVTQAGGMLFVESGIDPDREDPVATFHARDSWDGNWTNWFRPTDAAVLAWLDATEFRVTASARPVRNRGCYAAVAAEDPDVAFYRDIEWQAGTRRLAPHQMPGAGA